jgi:flap endonuclease-1
MGVNLKDVLIRDEFDLKQLKGKIVAFDAFNVLFQFLSTIRGPDGALLTDNKGQVTSHLIGLFSRMSKLIKMGVRPIFVFDGQAPELKRTEQRRRRKLKEEAQKKYEEALEREDLDDAKKYAARTTRLTSEMIDDSKELLTYLGIPVVQAPSEGEAQAAYMVAKGDAWAVASQDYDSLLYGAPRVIQNLSIVGRRKFGARIIHVKPMFMDLEKNLKALNFTRDQLICAAMLVGTDFQPGGVRGIGPKKSLAALKKYGEDFELLFKELKWEEHSDVIWQEVFDVIHKMPTTDDYDITFTGVQEDKLKHFLVKEHDFSEDRVDKSIKELSKVSSSKQKSLSAFFS